MTLEAMLNAQIERNAVLLGEGHPEGSRQPALSVYTVIDSDASAAEFLGMSEEEFSEWMGRIVCRHEEYGEIEGD